MNEITVTLSLSKTHTIYKRIRSKFSKNFKISKFSKISKMSYNFKISKNFKISNILSKFQISKFQKNFINFQESYVIKQLLHLNLINMRFYGAEYNNIELGFTSFNIVVLCSIKPHIDLV